VSIVCVCVCVCLLSQLCVCSVICVSIVCVLDAMYLLCVSIELRLIATCTRRDTCHKNMYSTRYILHYWRNTDAHTAGNIRRHTVCVCLCVCVCYEYRNWLVFIENPSITKNWKLNMTNKVNMTDTGLFSSTSLNIYIYCDSSSTYCSTQSKYKANTLRRVHIVAHKANTKQIHCVEYTL